MPFCQLGIFLIFFFPKEHPQNRKIFDSNPKVTKGYKVCEAALAKLCFYILSSYNKEYLVMWLSSVIYYEI